MASADDIRNNGLDAAKAAAYNGSGEFWATTDPAVADLFAQVNPAGGAPARLDFEISVQVLHQMMTQSPPIVYQHGSNVFEFLPASFALLNQHMTGKQVLPLP